MPETARKLSEAADRRIDHDRHAARALGGVELALTLERLDRDQALVVLLLAQYSRHHRSALLTGYCAYCKHAWPCLDSAVAITGLTLLGTGSVSTTSQA